MSYNTQQDILDFVEDNNVKFVRFAFCDIFGTQKNIAVLASDLPKAMEDGVCFDGSSIAGFMKVEESDLVLRPDLSTVTILPWRPTEGRVMQFFCDVEKPDGAAFGGNCRGFLRQMSRSFRKLGLTCNVGAECEFYLFENDDRGRPTRIPIDFGGYFDVAPLDAGENLRIYQNAGQIAAELNDAERTTRWLTEYVKRVREENPAVDLSRAELWLQLGNAALTKRDFTAAARYYRELQAGPFAVQARLREAVALSDGGKTEEALQTLRTARTNLKLDAPVLFSAEASLLMEKGRAPEALEVMNAALEAHPTDPEILYEAAMLAQETGASALSEKRLQTLLSMNPEHVQANNALGYLWVEQNRNLTEARALLEKAYRADPLNPYILDSMGWLCYREGRLRAAREFVSASLKKLYDAEVAAHLVIILQKSGDQKAAEATFAELLEHDPEHPTVARLRELLGKKP